MNWWEKDIDLDGDRGVWDAVLGAYSGARPTHSGWVRARCPMCEEASGNIDKKASLGLNTKTGGYNCQKCLAHGRLPLSYRERLADVLDGDVEFSTAVEPASIIRSVEPAPGFTPLFGPGELTPAYAKILEYATNPKTVRNAGGKPCRGIPAERVVEMGLGTGTHKLTGRLVFPIFDWQNPLGPWLGWFARDATGMNPIPHLYSIGLSRHTTLWNAQALLVETDEPVFIMEGCLDAQAAWPHGVACLGKPLETHQVLFRRAKRPIVVCLDGDSWREGLALAWTLKHLGKRCVNLRLPAMRDPDDVPREFLFSEAARLLRG